ncbi:Protein of unknown function [Actinacidiphila alni]|uniref:DUF3152 domain-containing protein n=1 Tax=Actinacidiphila alni TaxID=380248 RepID=A0A1I2LRB9_9ACTN|nr:DUF3152 domain-containing protein [Actinacidiphila alni]SFF81825.1 Protein of unknown function [Actinacidiphila alni]
MRHTTRQVTGSSTRRRLTGLLAAASAAVALGASVAGCQAARHADSAAPAAVRPVPSTSAAASGSPAGGTTASPITVPASGSGRFTVSRLAAKAVGEGTPLRYRVEVEDSIGLDADDAAREVGRILADPRGWTADGSSAFRLVASGPADLIVRIATPGTVDALCGDAGLDTGGELNCTVDKTVLVNLKRWLRGSPEFDGPIGEYRALVINHEVGHRLGHGHEGCPGPGKPAPAMMQQIKGLHGCVANAWPYDRRGHYLGGPSVP